MSPDLGAYQEESPWARLILTDQVWRLLDVRALFSSRDRGMICACAPPPPEIEHNTGSRRADKMV